MLAPSGHLVQCGGLQQRAQVGRVMRSEQPAGGAVVEESAVRWHVGGNGGVPSDKARMSDPDVPPFARGTTATSAAS